MKYLTILLLCFCLSFQVGYALSDNAQSAILMEATSEEVLFDKNSQDKMYPASTTKIMTLILVYEALNDGQLHKDDMITASAYAASMGGSQIYLKEGEVMSVDDLLKSIFLSSANDACVAFSEHISGTSDEFVNQMNQKAKELKLKNTNFVNCTGLHDDNHYTCAYDLAMMAKYLLEIGKDDLLSYTTLKEDYIRNDTFWLVNTNKLLGQNEMITGLKTGYTKNAGYCLVSTATKNGQTMIGVLLKEPKATIRNAEMLEMLNYGFSQYQLKTLFKQNDIIETIELPLTKEKNISVLAKDNIEIPVKKDDTTQYPYTIQYMHKGSFNQGDVIGYLQCKDYTFELIANSNATPLTFNERLFEIFKNMI